MKYKNLNEFGEINNVTVVFLENDIIDIVFDGEKYARVYMDTQIHNSLFTAYENGNLNESTKILYYNGITGELIGDMTDKYHYSNEMWRKFHFFCDGVLTDKKITPFHHMDSIQLCGDFKQRSDIKGLTHNISEILGTNYQIVKTSFGFYALLKF